MLENSPLLLWVFSEHLLVTPDSSDEFSTITVLGNISVTPAIIYAPYHFITA